MCLDAVVVTCMLMKCKQRLTLRKTKVGTDVTPYLTVTSSTSSASTCKRGKERQFKSISFTAKGVFTMPGWPEVSVLGATSNCSSCSNSPPT